MNRSVLLDGMTNLVINEEWLKAHDACEQGIDDFLSVFSRRKCCRITYNNLMIAAKSGLSVYWLAQTILNEDALAEFDYQSELSGNMLASRYNSLDRKYPNQNSEGYYREIEAAERANDMRVTKIFAKILGLKPNRKINKLTLQESVGV